jgi:hypothetical protein
MPHLSYAYGKFLLRLLTALLLVLCMTSCAAVPTALSPVQCQHPLIDPSTDHGVYRALLSYEQEIDNCNALNGFEVPE